MARVTLDKTGNEVPGRNWAKINRMFTELYGLLSGAVAASVTALTASGTVAANALTSVTSVVSATMTASGLITGNTLKLDTGTKTATATAGAATLAKASGKITSEALTTAADALYTLTITNTQIAAADTAFASLANGTNTQGQPVIERVTPGVNSLVVVVRNRHASEALNGTLVISFASLKA